jgi:DNA-binding NtrC family response regulator
MRELFATLQRLAQLDSTIVIQGETGTGKELVARALHEASPRARKPFVVVDCGALPEQLLESELFGHVRGAFTGATTTRAGAIESASGGTVFLDEIGELPLAMQPKLLRALESRTVRRLGESTHRPVDVRFLSATHRDLRSMVNAGAFREDLYFRLAVLPVAVPPLRQRLDDLPLLVDSFRPGANAEWKRDLLREALDRPWLGNVRELRNFVERAVAFGARQAAALSDAGAPAPTPAPPAAITTGGVLEGAFEKPYREFRDEAEREYLRRLIQRHGGNVTAAAQAAGIDRTYIHRLVRKHER